MKKTNVVRDLLLSAYCMALLASSYLDTDKEQSEKILNSCLKFARLSGNQLLIDLANRELGIQEISKEEANEIQGAIMVLNLY